MPASVTSQFSGTLLLKHSFLLFAEHIFFIVPTKPEESVPTLYQSLNVQKFNPFRSVGPWHQVPLCICSLHGPVQLSLSSEREVRRRVC